jgi:hypothetical protein
MRAGDDSGGRRTRSDSVYHSLEPVEDDDKLQRSRLQTVLRSR